MTVFRSPMEKILTEQENETVVTNPRERFRTFLRKLAYRREVWLDRLRRLTGRTDEAEIGQHRTAEPEDRPEDSGR